VGPGRLSSRNSPKSGILELRLNLTPTKFYRASAWWWSMIPSFAAPPAARLSGCFAMPRKGSAHAHQLAGDDQPVLHASIRRRALSSSPRQGSREEIRVHRGRHSRLSQVEKGCTLIFTARVGDFCDACFSGNYPVHFEDEGHTRSSPFRSVSDSASLLHKPRLCKITNAVVVPNTNNYFRSRP